MVLKVNQERPGPLGFITSPSTRRSEVWIWALGLCSIPPLAAAVGMTAKHIKVLKGIYCTIMPHDWINIGVTVATFLILFYGLFSTGPSKPFRILPFYYPLHIVLITFAIVAAGIGCWSSSSSCSDWKKACPAQVKLAGTQQWRFHNKKCDFYKTKLRMVRDLAEGAFGAVLEKRKGGSGGKKTSNDSKEEEARFACWIVVVIFLGVWWWFEIIMWMAAVSEAKKKQGAEAAGMEPEQMEQLKSADEETQVHTYQGVDTAYRSPTSPVPYDPNPAPSPFGQHKDGVNVKVNGVK